MRRLICVITASILLSGCGLSIKARRNWDPLCRHDAVYAAMTSVEDAANSGDVLIAVGPTNRKYTHGPYKGQTITHAQATRKDVKTGRWMWLKVSDGLIVEAEQDKFKPEKYYTIENFIKRYGLFKTSKERNGIPYYEYRPWRR